VAIPLLSVTEAQSVVLPVAKVTEPEGVPPKAPVTVAVNVTACPTLEGFGAAVTVVVVAALLTI
jgi:hypothetical protein